MKGSQQSSSMSLSEGSDEGAAAAAAAAAEEEEAAAAKGTKGAKEGSERPPLPRAGLASVFLGCLGTRLVFL